MEVKVWDVVRVSNNWKVRSKEVFVAEANDNIKKKYITVKCNDAHSFFCFGIEWSIKAWSMMRIKEPPTEAEYYKSKYQLEVRDKEKAMKNKMDLENNIFFYQVISWLLFLTLLWLLFLFS